MLARSILKHAVVVQGGNQRLFSKTASVLRPNKQQQATEQQQLEWKKNVVEVPIATTIEDLKKNHRMIQRNQINKNDKKKDSSDEGFYVSHRIYVEKVPEKYTVEPFETRRTGGYDVETGERMFKRVGGGLPIQWYFVDFKRVGPPQGSGPPLVEKVIELVRPRDRTAFLALVAHGNSKRYILATQNMKVGDLIRTSAEIPRLAVQAYEGDAYPCGAYSIGTVVHNIEVMPGEGAKFCRAAGSSGVIKSQMDGRVVIQLPSDLEISVARECMATVGQVSHASHKDEKMSHPVDKRDKGYRPRSGLWQRKDGYSGRKIHPPKPIKVMTGEVKEKTEHIAYTYPNWSLTE